jgi:hypothetical protein
LATALRFADFRDKKKPPTLLSAAKSREETPKMGTGQALFKL